MNAFATLLVVVLLACPLVHSLQPFISPKLPSAPSPPPAPSNPPLPAAPPSTRRSVLSLSLPLLLSPLLPSLPAFADETSVSDLSAPDAPPAAPASAKSAEEEMAERLRKKAELQRKTGGGPALSYKESFKGELDKQQGMKKTKQQLRDDMCEELGRGC